MEFIELTRLYCLDENVTNPKCYICGKECSSYRVEDDELLKLFKNYDKFKYFMVKAELLYLNNFGVGKHLVFLCKACKDKDINELRKIKLEKE